MKKIALCLIVLASSIPSSFADKCSDYEKDPQNQLDQILASVGKNDQQGCCSWHGGVCGCSMGHAVCCDGGGSGCGC
jgi:hypothetical protein